MRIGPSTALPPPLWVHIIDRVILGTDMPYDIGNGEVSIKQTMEAIDGMEIPDAGKKKIFGENALKWRHLWHVGVGRRSVGLEVNPPKQ